MKISAKPSAFPRILRAACLLSLGSLALMVWSLFDPRPIPVIVAMSVGQVLGTLSLIAFLAVVVADMRLAHLEREAGAPQEPPDETARTVCDRTHRLHGSSSRPAG